MTSGGTPNDGLNEAMATAEELLSAEKNDAALETFKAILAESPSHAGAYAGMVRAYIALKDIAQAEAVLNGAPVEIVETTEMETAFAQLQLEKQAEEVGPLTELLIKVGENPDDHNARLDLAQAMYGAGKVEDAVAELLELFRRDPDWNNGAAKAQLFTIFEALKPNDPIVLNARRKLSSLIFA